MEIIEIPFGAKDSELQEWTYTIPDGMEAEIKDGKVIIKKKKSKDEQIKEALISYLNEIGNSGGVASFNEFSIKEYITYLEKRKEQESLEYLPKKKVYDIMSKLTSLSYSNLIPINSEAYRKIDEITSDVLDLLNYPIEKKQEVDLEEEIKKYLEPITGTEIRIEPINSLEKCARYFYELGLRAKKEK